MKTRILTILALASSAALMTTCTEPEDIVLRQTKDFNSSLEIHERAREGFLDSLLVGTEASGSDIDKALWHYFAGNYFLTDSLVWEDMIVVNEYRVNRSSGTKATNYLLLALSALQQGDLELSSSYIENAITESNTIKYDRIRARCRYVKAWILEAQANYDAALEELSVARELAYRYNKKIKKYRPSMRLLVQITAQIGHILEKTGGEFQGKNCYDWYTEAAQIQNE